MVSRRGWLVANPKLKMSDASKRWLLSQVGEKNYLLGTKPQFNKVMGMVSFPLKVRVWACVYRHTMGWLPSGAGLAWLESSGDPKLKAECERLGAVLALTNGPGPDIPLTSALIASELNSHAKWEEVQRRRSLPADERELEPEVLDALYVRDENVRAELDTLESEGFLVRTDDRGRALASLRTTPHGRKQLLALRGKSRIFFYLEPKVSSSEISLLGDDVGPTVSDTYKNVMRLYRHVLRLRLVVDPKLFATDEKLQSTILREIEERDRLMAERDLDLRAALVAHGAIPMEPKKAKSSTVSNPAVQTPEQVLSSASARSGRETVEKDSQQRNTSSTASGSGVAGKPGSSPTVEPGSLVSHPRVKPKSAAELACIGEELLYHGIEADAELVRQIFAHSRDNAPDCTPEEVAARVPDAVRNMGKGVKRPKGWMLTALPKLFESPGFARWRADRELERRQVSSETVTPCELCGGSGLVGRDYETLEEQEALIREGAQFCDCKQGHFLADSPTLQRLMRSAS